MNLRKKRRKLEFWIFDSVNFFVGSSITKIHSKMNMLTVSRPLQPWPMTCTPSVTGGQVADYGSSDPLVRKIMTCSGKFYSKNDRKSRTWYHLQIGSPHPRLYSYVFDSMPAFSAIWIKVTFYVLLFWVIGYWIFVLRRCIRFIWS